MEFIKQHGMTHYHRNGVRGVTKGGQGALSHGVFFSFTIHFRLFPFFPLVWQILNVKGTGLGSPVTCKVCFDGISTLARTITSFCIRSQLWCYLLALIEFAHG